MNYRLFKWVIPCLRMRRKNLWPCLRCFQEVFAWSYKDMPRIDTNIQDTDLSRHKACQAKIYMNETLIDPKNLGRERIQCWMP